MAGKRCCGTSDDHNPFTMTLALRKASIQALSSRGGLATQVID
jgi:hypothetical protein